MVAHGPESATLPKERPKTRKERREAIRRNYLADKAKRLYSHTPVLDTSLEEDESIAAASISGTSITGVCSRCLPILSRYKDIFQGLTQHGSKLKRLILIDPKLPERAHYWTHCIRKQSYSQSRSLCPLSSTKVSQLKQIMDNLIST